MSAAALVAAVGVAVVAAGGLVGFLAAGARFGPWAIVTGHPGGYAGAGDPIEPDEWLERRCWTVWGGVRWCDRNALGYVVRYRPWAEERALRPQGWR